MVIHSLAAVNYRTCGAFTQSFPLGWWWKKKSLGRVYSDCFAHSEALLVVASTHGEEQGICSRNRLDTLGHVASLCWEMGMIRIVDNSTGHFLSLMFTYV